jgi:hypothetical protein
MAVGSLWERYEQHRWAHINSLIQMGPNLNNDSSHACNSCFKFSQLLKAIDFFFFFFLCGGYYFLLVICFLVELLVTIFIRGAAWVQCTGALDPLRF